MTFTTKCNYEIMKSVLCLYFIVAVKATNLTSKLPEKTTIVPDLEKIAQRKSFANEIINIFGAFRNDNSSNNNVINLRSKKEEVNYSHVLFSFLNKTYVCGSPKSKEIAPDLLATIEAVSQLPFMDYIITDTVKINTVNTVKKCASDTKTKNKLKKKSKKKKNITRTKNLETFFTGAFDDNIATKEKEDKKVISIETNKLKDLKSNNAVIDQFRTILGGIIDDIDAKYSEKGEGRLVKVIFEIGDNLKMELNKKNDNQDKPKTKNENDDDRLTLNDVLFRTNTAIKKIDESSDRDLLRRNMESESESNHDADVADEDSSDNIVLNNNMEIFVRMNKQLD